MRKPKILLYSLVVIFYTIGCSFYSLLVNAKRNVRTANNIFQVSPYKLPGDQISNLNIIYYKQPVTASILYKFHSEILSSQNVNNNKRAMT